MYSGGQAQVIQFGHFASGESPGFVSPETAEQAAVLYQFVGEWLVRARQVAADPAYRLDVYVPQGLPHHWRTTPRTHEQLTGMRDAFQTAQARVALRRELVDQVVGVTAGAPVRDQIAGRNIAARLRRQGGSEPHQREPTT